MFCQNCGSQNADGTAFCASCGAKLENQAVNANDFSAPQAPVGNSQAMSKVNNLVSKLKGNKKVFIAIIAAVLAVILLITVITAAFPSRKSVAESFVKAYLKYDFKKADKYVFLDLEDSIKKYCEEEDIEKDEFFDELTDRINDDDVEIKNLSDYYSYMEKTVKEDSEFNFISCKVDSEEEIDLDDEDEKSALAWRIYLTYSYAGVDEDEAEDLLDHISKAYEITVEVKYKDEDGERDTRDFDIYVVKYKGKWRVVSSINF